MVPILSLWLPIVVSAVFVFLVSFALHMVLTYHYADFRKVPDENAFADALRKLGIPPGEYMFPYAGSPKESRAPEFQKAMEQGLGTMLTVWPGGRPSMVNSLVQWFIYCVVVGVFAAYIAGRALGPGAEYLSVFRFAGCTAFACYAVAGWQRTIWFRESWTTTAKNSFDGLVYAAVTAGTFGWLWPSL